MDILDRRQFILDHTRLQSPPHVEEIRLHLADDQTSLWRLSEKALEDLGLPAPFWAFAWAGGQALARYILDHPDEVRGRRVLDFASGSGLAGIAAAIAGAEQVTAADIDGFAGIALQLNAEANQRQLAFIQEDVLNDPALPVDVILAGDVFYDAPMAARVGPWLGSAHREGVRVLVGDPGRAYLPRSALTQLAEYRVATHGALEDQEIKRTAVFVLADHPAQTDHRSKTTP